MKLSQKIQKINQKGIENLNTKGISIPKDSTTDIIMDNILNIVNGGESVVYSNIVYNDDNTITLIDDKGNIHTISCVYEGDKIVSISYDGENIDLEFNGETLVNFGGTQIDMSKVPVTSGASECVEYESVIYNDDNTVTLTKSDGTVHTMTLNYNDENRIAGVMYDDEAIEVGFVDGKLANVDGMEVDLSNIPTTSGGVISVCNTTTPTPSKFIEIRHFDIIGPITFPNTTTIIEEAFRDCTSLTEVDLPAVIEICRQAFSKCTSLTEVNLPLATSIGNHAFEDCTNLTKVDLPLATSIGDCVFYNCTNLTEGNLPLVTSIGGGTFHKCTSLTKINLPLATSIGGNSFDECINLTEVNLPLLANVSDYTFDDCTNLTKVDLSSATSIGKCAFRRCTNLTKVDLPLTTSIDDSAFFKCENLEAVILRTTERVCTIHTNAFAIDATAEGIPTKFNDNFYVPASMFEQYRAAYEPAFNQMGFTGYFDILFHKIEDYPEICG